jgi:putative lipoic acid-binding regulatory protein
MAKKGGAAPIYPCRFPIKVIGENTEKLAKIILEVMSSFGEAVCPDGMATKNSQNGKYLSITFEIVAQSREHIERIYAGLSARKEVKMVL